MNDNLPIPDIRMRRLRYHPAVRKLIQGPRLDPSKLIWPLFVRSGEKLRQEIPSMPGQFQLSIDELVDEAQQAFDAGLGGILLFGLPDEKDATGSDSYSDQGIVQQAVSAVKEAVPELLVITDVCFCEYTDHGHCGLLHETKAGMDVDNDSTLTLLGQQAVSHAQAGSDMIAPSGMMDGMVEAIRTALDEAGFNHLPLMSYAAKYASSFYGPFRDAAESSPQFGDRRTYQMDPAGLAGQALREVELDLAEGADLIMVKPALAYLDIVRQVRDTFPGIPLATYNVSGEYSMVKAAAERGWIDEKTIVCESLTAMHRAGADILITYWAKEVADWMAS